MANKFEFIIEKENKNVQIRRERANIDRHRNNTRRITQNQSVFKVKHEILLAQR